MHIKQNRDEKRVRREPGVSSLCRKTGGKESVREAHASRPVKHICIKKRSALARLQW